MGTARRRGDACRKDDLLCDWASDAPAPASRAAAVRRCRCRLVRGDAGAAGTARRRASRARVDARGGRAAARREFGPETQLMEESREARGITLDRQGCRISRYGMRLMRRAPGFAAAAILTIALGIGATTAMFSVVYGIVLKPLPYRRAGSPGQPLDRLDQARFAARLRRHGERLRLEGAQPRVRGHCGAPRRRQFQPDRPRRARAVERLARLVESLSGARRYAAGRPGVHRRRRRDRP